MNRLLVLDQDDAAEMIKERKKKGLDLYDEVWDGVYVMPSLPDMNHQRLVNHLTVIFNHVLGAGHGEAFPGANVSDRNQGWKENYRCPDVLAILPASRPITRRAAVERRPELPAEMH